MSNHIPDRARKIDRMRRDIAQGDSLTRAAARQGICYNTARTWLNHGAPAEREPQPGWWAEGSEEYERHCVQTVEKALRGFERRRQDGLKRDRRRNQDRTANMPQMRFG